MNYDLEIFGVEEGKNRRGLTLFFKGTVGTTLRQSLAIVNVHVSSMRRFSHSLSMVNNESQSLASNTVGSSGSDVASLHKCSSNSEFEKIPISTHRKRHMCVKESKHTL